MDKETVPNKNLLMYFYVYLDALKTRRMEEFIIIIRFDGCFLKGACKSELLVVVGKKENNQIFLIAWIVVDKKIKHN